MSRSIQVERVSPGKMTEDDEIRDENYGKHPGMSIVMLFFWLVLIFIIVFVILLLLRPVWTLTPGGVSDLGKIALTAFVVALLAVLIIWIIRACTHRR